MQLGMRVKPLPAPLFRMPYCLWGECHCLPRCQSSREPYCDVHGIQMVPLKTSFSLRFVHTSTLTSLTACCQSAGCTLASQLPPQQGLLP